LLLLIDLFAAISFTTQPTVIYGPASYNIGIKDMRKIWTIAYVVLFLYFLGEGGIQMSKSKNIRETKMDQSLLTLDLYIILQDMYYVVHIL